MYLHHHMTILDSTLLCTEYTTVGTRSEVVKCYIHIHFHIEIGQCYCYVQCLQGMTHTNDWSDMQITRMSYCTLDYQTAILR